MLWFFAPCQPDRPAVNPRREGGVEEGGEDDPSRVGIGGPVASPTPGVGGRGRRVQKCWMRVTPLYRRRAPHTRKATGAL